MKETERQRNRELIGLAVFCIIIYGIAAGIAWINAQP